MTSKPPSLIVRHAQAGDVPAIAALVERAYPNIPAYSHGMLRGQINAFPEGVWVAIYDDEIVGYCASIRISGSRALKPHTWYEITGNGFASRHDVKGDWVYGMDVSVGPDHRRLRIGQRFYKMRQDLCQWHELKGIMFGGRIPGYQRIAKQYPDARDYVRAVQESKLRDPVLSFQLRQGFEVLGVLKNYMPEDFESGGNATQMFWRNPLAQEAIKAKPSFGDTSLPERVRVATVQFQMRRISSIDEFEQRQHALLQQLLAEFLALEAVVRREAEQRQV